MKIIRTLLASIIFIFLLLAVYLTHCYFFKVDVVFYSALADGAITTIFAAIIIYSLNYFSLLNWFEKLQLTIIWLLASYAFAISVPTVIDRSLSFYILEKLQQRGGNIALNKFSDIFSKEYLPEHRLVDVRLTEQLNSGTITIEDNCVKLSVKGQRIATFSRFFRQHLLPKQRLLMGEYTDDLTDPFRTSQTTVNYQCQ